MQSTSSTTVFSNVHTDMTDPEGPVARPQHGSDSGKEAYSCLCSSFILVLCTVLVIFVIGIVKASMADDGYALGNMVFMGLCIAIIIMLIFTSLSCLCMCHKRYTYVEGDGISNKTSSNKGGAYYIVAWNMKILKQSGTDCPICWEQMDSKQELKAKLVCQHVFHYQCWMKYSQMTDIPSLCCPLCRATPIKFPGVERIKSDLKIFVDRFRCFVQRREPPDSETPGVAMIDV
ncbi:uncharacterized protein LOC125647893 isoform X2 [Ostrea edulis]|uniref:uncharacterized protein LOC125647893 isoform X2 n=1 Tax=Ostrea edulis TaxID=37623 RepID=UPI00209601A3|nr:uncharacterized protein LOC125647893 isoform X2 [Ostrea edulis]